LNFYGNQRLLYSFEMDDSQGGNFSPRNIFLKSACMKRQIMFSNP